MNDGAAEVIDLDLHHLWYGAPGKKRHLQQERFIFAPHRPWGCPRYQGDSGGRGLGKSYALSRKAQVLALLNAPPDPALPLWGALFGRTMKEVHHKLLPVIYQDAAEIREETGLDLMPRLNKEDQTLHWPNGSAAYILSYEDPKELNKARGYTLGWAIIDEADQHTTVSTDQVLAVVNFAVRDPRAAHQCICWASSANGLRGFHRLHHEAWQRKDRNFWLVGGTIFDNPYFDPVQVELMRSGTSKRLWLQEGLGVCLTPRNVVFGEYLDRTHVKPYDIVTQIDGDTKLVIFIDWGTSHAYVGAAHVNLNGRWVVFAERKEVDTTYPRFRRIVQEFVAECVERTGGRPPYLMACDGAVRSETLWLKNTYQAMCEGGVWSLPKDWEQRLDWGLALISSMLDPADGTRPRLYLSAELNASTDDAVMGLRGAFLTYTYATFRTEVGEVVLTNTPSKRNNADHPIDALRYAICCSAFDADLHGGKTLPYLDLEVPGDQKAA
ncbi:MAG: hypothetical protein H6716_28315 [Polyangiaceae bacterium]|nr:hypothetical protein [Polyangiaceae bacterium]